ncbi:MAG: NifB/NifX family molybdenum-iron cluster-binding protein [candidate division Zixibacteria bacterium]|nr:NifB/NifX family molybdenum-iron cluster-binding protein [candidate division Zixibacteria bacterium]MDD5425789.1 NifB/NifX family molybdenum-iron cluster-binding protein [candidate division Zixibacteria bacterium]
MKIAIPTENGVLCPHFGHCRQFTFIEINTTDKKIIDTRVDTPPLHEPGVLPRWLEQMDCDLVIAGGMGQRAIALFRNAGIKVLSGAPSKKPEEIVADYLAGQLNLSANLCDEPGFHEGGHKDCSHKNRQH